MKSKDFADHLEKLSTAYANVSVHANGNFLSQFVPLFRAKPNAKAGDILSLIETASIEAVSLADLIDVVASQLTQKKPARKEKNAPRDDVVACFVNELEQQMGKEDFSQIFARLKARGTVSEDEAKLISKRFYGEPGKTKTAALANIWRRHQSIVDLKALGRASAGRSAA